MIINGRANSMAITFPCVGHQRYRQEEVSEADLTTTTPEYNSVIRGICKGAQIIVSLGFADSRHALPAYTPLTLIAVLYLRSVLSSDRARLVIHSVSCHGCFQYKHPLSLAVLFLSMKHIWQRGTSAAVVKVKNCAC